MFTILAVLVYLFAMSLPIYLLYKLHSQHWSWHVLAIVAAIGLGFVPIPAQLQQPGFDLVIGFGFIALMIWGAGGLITYQTRGHHEKHA
jgi:hypothetical protein